ncbi:MAG: hypothetical protein ACRD4L_05150 [Pyrinomonadaceae bacterium]
MTQTICRAPEVHEEGSQGQARKSTVPGTNGQQSVRPGKGAKIAVDNSLPASIFWRPSGTQDSGRRDQGRR